MRTYRRNMILFVLHGLLQLHGAFAQAPHSPFIFTHIDDPKKIPPNSGWGLFKDQEGFLWMGGLNGLVQFDGSEARVFRSSDSDTTSLKDNGVTRIVQDRDNNLWIGSFEALNFFERKKGIFKKFYPGRNKDTATFTMPFHIDNNDQLWLFSSAEQALYVFDIHRHTSKLVCKTQELLKFYPTSPYTQPDFAITPNLSGGLTLLKFKNYQVVSRRDFFIKNDENKFPLVYFNRNFYIQNDSIAWIGSDIGLVEFNFKMITYRVYDNYKRKPIRNFGEIASLKDRYLLAGTNDDGLMVFDLLAKEFVNQYTHDPLDPGSISGNTIGEIVPDNKGNIFITISGKGLEIVNTAENFVSRKLTRRETSLANVDNDIKALVKLNDSIIWVAAKLTGLYEWNYKKNSITENNLLKKVNDLIPDSRIQQLYFDNSQMVFISSSKGLVICNLVKNKVTVVQLPGNNRALTSVNYCMKINDTSFLASTSNSIYNIVFNEGEIRINNLACFDSLVSPENKNILVDDRRRLIYVMGNYGSILTALSYENNQFSFLWRKELNRIVNSMERINDSLYWLSTSEGFLKFNANTREVKKEGIPNLTKEPVYFQRRDKTGGWWIVQRSYLTLFNPPTESVEERIFLSNKQSNLFTISAACVSLPDNKLLLGSSQGVAIIDFDKRYENNSAERIIIRNVFMNDIKKPGNTLFDEGDTIRMEPSDKTITLELGTIHYQSDIDVELQYKLDGYDKDWITSVNVGSVRYTNLSSGNYQFLIRSAANSRMDPRAIRLIIKGPFWKKAWFILLMLLLSGLLIFWLIGYRGKQIRKEAEIKSNYENKMLHLEMQNLRSQMNPHFIFNSLNSINSFIVENKTHLASDYLTKFSKLIRLILDNSRNELISLDRELETLQLYLLMETLRFDQKFGFEITVEENLDREAVRIPPMIIQPYVENAIWHGLMQKNGKGKVTIGLQKSVDNQFLLITIYDNGVGREKAAKLSSKSGSTNKSFGMEITRNRIAKLAPENFVEILDLQDEHGNACGTKVQLGLMLNQFPGDS